MMCGRHWCGSKSAEIIGAGAAHSRKMHERGAALFSSSLANIASIRHTVQLKFSRSKRRDHSWRWRRNNCDGSWGGCWGSTEHALTSFTHTTFFDKSAAAVCSSFGTYRAYIIIVMADWWWTRFLYLDNAIATFALTYHTFGNNAVRDGFLPACTTRNHHGDGEQ